jgi:polyhydroxyalkanoate synthesis regulator phasin
MDKDLMWFFDEIPQDYRNFRRHAGPLEREYLELRRLLGEAEARLKAEPDSEELQAKVRYLTKRVQDLENKAPYLADDVLKEVALWGVPH